MTLITDLKRINHVIDHSTGRPQSEYWGYYDEQLIGVKSTNLACEKMLDDYAYDLLSDGLHIPATALDGVCGDCTATLDSMGLCGCRAEEPTATRGDAIWDYEPQAPAPTYTKQLCKRCNQETTHVKYAKSPFPICCPCRAEDDQRGWDDAHATPADHTRPAPLTCICGQPALMIKPEGAFCGGYWEASGLWQLWKSDSTAFVAELRRQSCRLKEMAERLVTYLSKKTGTNLSCDSVLAMWRQLLAPYEMAVGDVNWGS